jgi:NAD(P)-dependent dehydrogenase (short-subunit alcohol dehydrogenase family)
MQPNENTVIITGANSGLGLATAFALASRRVPVLLACRRLASAEEARASILASIEGLSPGAVRVAPLDLSDQESIVRFAATIEPASVRALVCNAGIQVVTELRQNAAGIEETFACNHLGHFLLARLLAPRLAARGRIVFVSSNTHDPKRLTGMPAPRLDDLAGLANGTAFDKDDVAVAGRRRYTSSKLCNVLNAYELSRRLVSSPAAAKQLDVLAFDPGLMPGTGLAREYGPVARWAWRNVMPAVAAVVPNVNAVSTSARRLANLVTEPLPTKPGDTVYWSCGRVRRSSAQSYDTDLATRLWDLSSRLTSLPTALQGDA